MKSYYLKALIVCSTTLLLILTYEALFPYIPAFQSFEPSHFWTEYTSTESDSSSISENNDFLEDLKNFETDSILADSSIALSDSSANDSTLVPQLSSNDSLILFQLENYTGAENLSSFFKKLKELKSGLRKKVRIAYFGDSTTEGDLIVANLREKLQKIFGGHGVGFVSIAPSGVALRKSIKHKYSKNWQIISYFRKFKNPEFEYGINGEYASTTEFNDDWSNNVTFSSPNGNFDSIYFYFGNGGENPAPDLRLVYNDNDTVPITPEAISKINRLSIGKANTTKIELAFNFSAPFPVYGLSFESENGILVDNLAKRSDSGSHFGRINKDVLQAFQELLGYDLIILHYGANVLSDKVINYGHYEQILKNTVRHFQSAMGDIPVIIIGTTDRVSKIEGIEQTTPAVYGLLKAQKRAAATTKSPFIDLFIAMGGEGSMIEWTKSVPPKAAPDFVHFSGYGANIISGIVFDYLSKNYNKIMNENFDGQKMSEY